MDVKDSDSHNEETVDSANHDWLYPELLSHDKLVEILKQRYIRHTDLIKLDKDQLVDLYYKYIIPLPQRIYRNNRRGQEMTKRQIAQAKKRKSTMVEAAGSSDKKKMKTADNESRFLTSYNLPSTGERIKPPPSCIDFGKKKIKLGSGSTSTKGGTPSTDEKTKSHIRLKEIAASLDEVQNSELSKVTEQTNSAIFPEKKIIKLNNKQPQTGCKTSQRTADGVPEKKSDHVKQEHVDSLDEISTKKTFKAAKISWP